MDENAGGVGGGGGEGKQASGGSSSKEEEDGRAAWETEAPSETKEPREARRGKFQGKKQPIESAECSTRAK